MSKKILYFTAAPKATSAELAQIATLNALAAPAYDVCVMCSAPKASLTGITLSAVNSDNSYNDAGGAITASTISAAASDNSLNDSGNGFVTGGFQVGDVLTIAGFTGSAGSIAANNKAATAIVVSVTAAKMVLKNITLVDDSAGEAVTVTSAGRFLQRGFKVGQKIMVRGFEGNTANNINSGVITSLTASKMKIGGSDGDVIVNDAAGESVTICTIDCEATYGGAVAIADYVAGTVPEQYKSSGTAIYTVFDPTNPPDNAALISTQAVISHGETVAVKTNGGATSNDATATVTAHACTVALPATKAIVSSTQEIAITSGSGTTKVTLTIAAGAISACVLS
jgi:hypothetical protein